MPSIGFEELQKKVLLIAAGAESIPKTVLQQGRDFLRRSEAPPELIGLWQKVLDLQSAVWRLKTSKKKDLQKQREKDALLVPVFKETVRIKCKECEGKGYVQPDVGDTFPCEPCLGTGDAHIICFRCEGKGHQVFTGVRSECWSCNGRGSIPEGEEVLERG